MHAMLINAVREWRSQQIIQTTRDFQGREEEENRVPKENL